MRQLRLRGVDVLTATEEHTNELADHLLLELGETKGRKTAPELHHRPALGQAHIDFAQKMALQICLEDSYQGSYVGQR